MARTRRNVYNLVYGLLLSLIHRNHKNLTKSSYNSLTEINYYPNQTMRKVWLQPKHVLRSKDATRQNKALDFDPGLDQTQNLWEGEVLGKHIARMT